MKLATVLEVPRQKPEWLRLKLPSLIVTPPGRSPG